MRALALLLFLPSLALSSSVPLPSLNGLPSTPLTITRALQQPLSPPLLDVNQLLQDLLPQSNLSTANDAACAAIHTALPSAPYDSRLCLSPFCANATSAFYNARQASNRPACVVAPRSASDVSTIVRLLRKHDVRYAVRSAGHSTGWNFSDSTGFSSTTGVLVDMRQMLGLSFEQSTGVARWEAGHSWGTLAEGMQKYGAQVAGGRLGAVGGGLYFGGGISWFSGQVGLGSDTSVAYEVVLPDGQFVTARPQGKYSDLFWALKVGGNAFGIITAVHSRTLPGNEYFGGSVFFKTEDMPAVLGALASWYQTDADACPKGFILPAITDVLIDSVITRLNVFEFFYDGPSPPSACFAKFQGFETAYNDTKVQPYADFLNKAFTNQRAIFTGFNNALGIKATDIPSAETLLSIYQAWEGHCERTGLSYLQCALTFSPMTRSTLAANKRAGGSPIGMEKLTEPFLWVGYVDGSVPLLGTLTDTRLFADSLDVAGRAVPQSKRRLPLYANYARVEQKPILTYEQESLQRFREVKKKYDPLDWVTRHTSGHTFY